MSTPFRGLRISQGHEYPAEPAHAIKQFFEDYSQDDIYFFFTALLECALTTNHVNFKDGKDRSNAIFFCNRAVHAFKATLTIRHKIIK